MAKKAVAAAVVGGTYTALGMWSYFAWYSGQTKAEFRITDEGWFSANTYAGGADKLGHAFANYLMTRVAAQQLRWGGFSPGFSAAVAGGLTVAFFLGIEVKDGYHRGFGYSRGDVVSNMVGVALAQAMLWSPRLDELFDFRMQYFPSPLFIRRLADGNIDAGEDYTGMDFGLWLHVGSLPLVRDEPRWWALHFVDIGLGYATRGYLPTPDDANTPHTRQLYLGVTANLAAVLDACLFDYGKGDPRARRVARHIIEFASVPFGTARFGPEWVTVPGAAGAAGF